MGTILKKTAKDYIADGDTPMMAQYKSIKTQHPDCLLFYRMGDFYELFFEDAVTAASVLDITLTKRGKTKGHEIDMCGVPYHSYEPYLAKLIHAGFKVGICEQLETPDQAKKRAGHKALVDRQVVRIVTQGTLTEEHLLNARENNYLASLCEIGGQYGLSWIDLSTGEFKVQPLTTANLNTSLDQINPSELLVPDNLLNDNNGLEHFTFIRDRITIQPKSLFDSQNSQERLEKTFGVGTLDAFGGFSRAEIAAAGSLIDYIDRTQKGNTPFLSTLIQVNSGDIMEIDSATRRNLELTKTLSGDRKGSLLNCIDKTLTGPGARLLQSRLSAPSTSIDIINQRLDELESFVSNQTLLDQIRNHLKSVPDMERSLSRITVGRGSPRDLGSIKEGLMSCSTIHRILIEFGQDIGPLSHIVQSMKSSDLTIKLAECLTKALNSELPIYTRDGNFINSDFNQDLDRFRNLKDTSKRHIALLESKYKKLTKIDSLKVSFNKVLGYFVEVTAKKADPLIIRKEEGRTTDNPFIHRQTTANAVRFTTAELSELERDISQAQDKALAIELEIFERLVNQAIALSSEIGVQAKSLATLDATIALAKLALEKDYKRPLVDLSDNFTIEKGRHPVVEIALNQQNGAKFIPNGCQLDDSMKLWLLTGPNMAGKSTFLRQNALIAILAQIGSFVPASNAHIGIIDKLFSRVGAADDLAKGRSTFMVEMVETATILNQATERSLVILDEIGRGTATFDGLSIAWACVEHLHDVNKCRSLFATHYHELTSLTTKLDNLSCHSLEVKEWKGDIIFMHTVKKGSADHSYGIHVAKLAGLPQTVINRARQVLSQLQKSEQSGVLSSLANDLPLFQSVCKTTQEPISKLNDRVNTLNPDELSPKQALEILYELKSLS